MSGKNIYQRINAVMSECDYLKKERAQQGTGVKYDTVIAMLRELLIKHGVVMVVRQTSMECIGGLSSGNQKIYQGSYEMDLVNMDDPNQKVTHSAFAHGMDGGDKAPGKAHTYAAKIMLTKGFGIETGDNEESRSEMQAKTTIIGEEKQQELSNLINGDEVLWSKLCSAFKIVNLSQLSVAKEPEFTKLIMNYTSARENINANNN
jgi:hypothetical protein